MPIPTGEAPTNENIQEQLCILVARRARKLLPSTREIGKLLDLDAPALSRLMNERQHGFSAERLMRFLVQLDHDIEVIVRPRPEKSKKKRGVFVVFKKS